jgi:hypothetical protein
MRQALSLPRELIPEPAHGSVPELPPCVETQSLGHPTGEAKRVAESQGRSRSKAAVILHRMWIDGTEFNWYSNETTNQSA